ncbi:hypothetical protein LCGC14_1916610, partial [marine sediment metagenome]
VQHDLDEINRRYKRRQRRLFWSFGAGFTIGVFVIYLLLKGVL